MTGFGIRLGLGSRSAYLFDPGQYGDVVAAWEADYGITLNAGNVSAWAPRWVAAGSSAAALALAQATASKQPLYVADRGDSRPAISFDGVDDTLFGAGAAALVSPGAYSAIVSGTLVTGVSTRILTLGVFGGSDRLLDMFRGANLLSNQLQKGGVSEGLLQLGATDPAAYRTYAASRVSTTHTVSRAGTSASGAAGSSSGNAANLLSLGSFFNSSNFGNLKISALWLYKSAVDVAAVSAAMQARWPNYG